MKKHLSVISVLLAVMLLVSSLATVAFAHECEPDEHVIRYEDFGSITQHKVKCDNCNLVRMEDHDFGANGECTKCQHPCPNNKGRYHVDDKNGTTHTEYCSICNKAMALKVDHVFKDGICTACGASQSGGTGTACTHTNLEYKAVEGSISEHTVHCKDCNTDVRTEKHDFDATGTCYNKCGYQCPHESLTAQKTDNAKMHELVCSNCNYLDSYENHKFDANTGKCVCGYTSTGSDGSSTGGQKEDVICEECKTSNWSDWKPNTIFEKHERYCKTCEANNPSSYPGVMEDCTYKKWKMQRMRQSTTQPADRR